MNRKYIFLLILVAAIGYIIYDSASQPNVNDLSGNLTEVATYRNENNTGPIVRVYAVTAQDTVWGEMEKYGNLMPYTKYGTTQVYFFDEGRAFPTQLTAESGHFDPKFSSGCMAVYLKDANGQVTFNKYPFGNKKR